MTTDTILIGQVDAPISATTLPLKDEQGEVIGTARIDSSGRTHLQITDPAAQARILGRRFDLSPTPAPSSAYALIAHIVTPPR